MRDYGATHVALFTFGYMKAYQDPMVHRYLTPETDWSLTDHGLLETGHMARSEGLHMIIPPTLADFYDCHWRGEVEMHSEDLRAQWFDS